MNLLTKKLNKAVSGHITWEVELTIGKGWDKCLLITHVLLQQVEEVVANIP